MISFDGQVVIVTGAGRGLGRLYALDLARCGARVVVNDLGGSVDGSGADPDVADQVAGEITRSGGTAVASCDSVASPEGGEAIVRAAVDTFGRLDAVVSNAGIFGTVPFDELPYADWRRMLDVHLNGSFCLSQPAFRIMKRQGYGRFVFAASSAGAFGQPEAAHYSAAKAGVTGLMNVIALEGAPHGVLANAVLPFGYSRMITSTVGDRELFPEEEKFYEAIRPELVAPVVTFLASRSCELNRQAFSAFGGRYARVFAGLAEGWLARPGADPAAEDIASHLAEITATEPFTVPGSIYDEVAAGCAQLGIL
ncbi:MAG: SDR family NAD(P)-dependent oxidoreductase [Streptosporangiales bacterium]|nr:SDR family NAD(P)-dependent oxidoreductase [Streptosporangiales bacterium]